MTENNNLFFLKKKCTRAAHTLSNTEFKVFLSTFRGPVPSNSITQQVAVCDTDQGNAENFYNENKQALQKLTGTQREMCRKVIHLSSHSDGKKKVWM